MNAYARGATAAGWHTAWVDRHHTTGPLMPAASTLRMHSLNTLPLLLPTGRQREQLLQGLADVGGRIVKSGSGPDLEKWPSRVAAARGSGRVPEMLYGGWCRGGYEIKLVDIPAWRLAVRRSSGPPPI